MTGCEELFKRGYLRDGGTSQPKQAPLFTPNVTAKRKPPLLSHPIRGAEENRATHVNHVAFIMSKFLWHRPTANLESFDHKMRAGSRTNERQCCGRDEWHRDTVFFMSVEYPTDCSSRQVWLALFLPWRRRYVQRCHFLPFPGTTGHYEMHFSNSSFAFRKNTVTSQHFVWSQRVMPHLKGHVLGNKMRYQSFSLDNTF